MGEQISGYYAPKGNGLIFRIVCVFLLTAVEALSISRSHTTCQSHAQSLVPRPFSSAAGTSKRGRWLPTVRTAKALDCRDRHNQAMPFRPFVQTRIQICGLHEILGHESTSSMHFRPQSSHWSFRVKLWRWMTQARPGWKVSCPQFPPSRSVALG